MMHSAGKVIAAVGLAVLSGGGVQAATLYSLSDDFSNLANPNGPWSLLQNATLLSFFLPAAGTNPLNGALGDGFWGVGPNLNTQNPEIGKTRLDGAAAAPFTNNDFLAGDVILHTPDNGANRLVVRWTAPANGIIDFAATVWYAHSPVNRVSTVEVNLTGAGLSVASTINNTRNRNNPFAVSGSGLEVAAGDVLAVSFAKSVGQIHGSVLGFEQTVSFTATPVPAPAAAWLFGTGLAALGVTRRRAR